MKDLILQVFLLKIIALNQFNVLPFSLYFLRAHISIKVTHHIVLPGRGQIIPCQSIGLHGSPAKFIFEERFPLQELY